MRFCLAFLLLAATSAQQWPSIALMQHLNARLAACDMAMLPFPDMAAAPDAKGAFELQLGDRTFYATMRLGAGGWEVLGDAMPDPCSDESLAVTRQGIADINSQNLGWTAKMRPDLIGKTPSDFGFSGGTEPIPIINPNRRVAVDGIDLPEAYDARDVYPGEYPCLAFKPRYQGSCGSCSHFAATAAFAARICVQNGHTSDSNVILSPQHIMDCTAGCDGGTAGGNFAWYQQNGGAKEEWCKPYAPLQNTPNCSDTCSGARSFTSSSGKLVNGERAMQMELLLNGPGAITIEFYNDLFGYSSGVYSRSAGASYVGNHNMALIGWGVENNISYWLVQNSHGGDWGDQGVGKFKRGSNECGIESYGMDTLMPDKLPPKCALPCGNGAATLADCSCRCLNPFMSGPQCTILTAVCENGGVMNQAQDQCLCPTGFIGGRCEFGFSMSHYAAAFDDFRQVKVYYVNALTSISHFINAKFQNVITGASERTSTRFCNDLSPCPLNGNASFYVLRPATPGRYRLIIYVVDYVSNIVNGATMGYFTVLPEYATSAPELDAAIAVNLPSAAIAAKLAAIQPQSAAMIARLDAAAAVKRSIMGANDPAYVKLDIISGGRTVLWGSAPPTRICYSVPAAINVASKRLRIMYLPGGSVLYNIPNQLTEARAACVDFVLPGTANIPSTAWAELVDDFGAVLAKSESFEIGRIILAFNSAPTATAGATVVLKATAIIVRKSDATVNKDDMAQLLGSDGSVAGTCQIFPQGVPAVVPSQLLCSFSVAKVAPGAPTRTPFTMKYFSAKGPTPSVILVQTAAQALSFAKLGL